MPKIAAIVEDDAVSAYLRLLHLKAEPPSLSFLAALVRSHLIHIPYENVSKLLGKDLDCTLVGYLRGILEQNFGGTCFAKATAFYELLERLGFKVDFIPMHDGLEVSHVALRVSLINGLYLIDLGLGAEFAGPFRLAVGDHHQTRLGLRDYHLSVTDGIRLWIMQGRRVVKSYRAKNDATIALPEVTKIWERSRREGSLLMSHLCLHQVRETATSSVASFAARMIWDHAFIEWQGGDFRKAEERARIPELASRHFGMQADLVRAAILRLDRQN